MANNSIRLVIHSCKKRKIRQLIQLIFKLLFDLITMIVILRGL